MFVMSRGHSFSIIILSQFSWRFCNDDGARLPIEIAGLRAWPRDSKSNVGIYIKFRNTFLCVVLSFFYFFIFFLGGGEISLNFLREIFTSFF